MLALFAHYKRHQFISYAVGITTLLLLALIIFALPKPSAYASPARLAETMSVFVILAAGLALWAIFRRQAREARLALNFHGAPRALVNTASFLLDERRSAARGILPAIVAAILLAGLWVVCGWPQLASLGLAPCQSLFGVMAAFSAFMAFASIYLHRKNFINAIYLRHYLRQQGRHVGFRCRTGQDAKRLAAQLRKPAVTCVTAHSFEAGGFVWQLDDFFKNTIVFGQPGSGKTVTILNTLLEGIFAMSSITDLPASGLILDPKGDFKNKVEILARRYGRENDVVILSASGWQQHGGTSQAIVYNPLDCADDGLEIAARLVTAGRISGGIQTKESFFIDAARAFLRHAIEFIRAADPENPPSMLDLRRLATESAGEEESDGPYFLALSEDILARYPDKAATPACVIDAIDFFVDEWRNMPDRQKAGVIGSITQLVDEFSVEPFRQMMSGKSTIRIADIIDQGKILYVDLPTSDRPRMATLVSGLIKLEYQREILRRVDKPRPSFFFCDEFPVLWTTGEGRGEADFFALSRGSRHANIVAAQNISSFYKKSDNKDEARNFLGNCALKFFLRNSEVETNEWASKLFGERAEIIVTANESASLNDGFKRGFTSYNRSTQTVRVVAPEVFGRLAVPMRDDPAHQYSECIVHHGGRAATEKLELVFPVNPL